MAEHLHQRIRPIAVVLCLAVLISGCSRISRLGGGGSAPTRKGTLTVSPTTGPVGTSFTLTGGGFRPGEPMTFEIDIPGKPRFVGPSHTAGPDGMVSSIYTPLKGDPPGTYQIKAVGSRGTRAEGPLTLTGG